MEEEKEDQEEHDAKEEAKKEAKGEGRPLKATSSEQRPTSIASIGTMSVSEPCRHGVRELERLEGWKSPGVGVI